MINPVQHSDYLRFAVASDLHVHTDEGDNSPSHLRAGSDESNLMQHPIASLCNLIDQESLTANAILCPGDLGDKANTVGIQYAWAKLQQLKTHLKATDIFGTVGNHDVDSRGVHNDFDPRGYLQSLTPRFPVESDPSYDQYWSRHFTVIERDCYRMVLLNSSAFHGFKDEHEHGRISKHTLSALRESLRPLSLKTINILLCHHHPLQHSENDLGEDDVMKGGQELLDLIGNSHLGEWIVIHGHKHHPKLTYAAGASSVTPIVFAAGSLCANLFKGIQGIARNQFYIIEFRLSDITLHGLVGTFRAWDWIYGVGWQESASTSGLPSHGGFGHRQRPHALASEINSALSEPTLGWNEMLNRVPVLRYVLPRDLTRTVLELNDKYKIAVLDQNGNPARLERTE